MSQANVEVVRRVLAALSHRDFEAVEKLNRSDVELDWSPSRGLDARVHHGREEVTRFCRDLLETFEAVELQPECFIESGDAVVVPNTAHLRGRNGVETIARSTFVFELRGGRVARIRLYQDRRQALDALGLSE